MKLEELQREVRMLMARCVAEIEGAVASGHTDINVATEMFLLELFREAYDLPGLRNLNDDRPNFPGVDLADDSAGIAFQVTASSGLGKVVESLTTVIREGLHETYPHVKIFIATKKQRTYKQETINKATEGKLRFDGKKDVLDYRDLLKRFRTFELDRLKRIAAILRNHFAADSAPTLARALGEALERDLARRYKQAVQRSTFPENRLTNVFADLARDALSAGAEDLPAALRRRILLRGARAAALTGRLDAAEGFLSAALVLDGPDTDLPARARIAEARGDIDDALRLLRDQKDSDSLSTFLSVLSRNQGDAAALSWFADEQISVGSLTSNGALTLSQIYLRMGRFGELLRTLDEVSEPQLAESPYLLLLRGITRIASVFPKPDQRLIFAGTPLHVDGTKPVLPESDLAVQLDAALADLQQLLPILRELNLPQTVRIAEAYALWCELLHPHRYAKALTQLRLDMLEPAKAVHRVQFAFAFDGAFIPQPLEEWLKKREALGGLDDDELRAALVIQMHRDTAGVARIVAQHRQRFQEILGEGLTLIIEVQALAAVKDATSARVLLDAGKGLLDPAAITRLEVEIAKAEGADPVVEHLRAYESTKTTETLRSLVNALAERADHRALGKYAELLYAETGDPRDIERAARAFAGAGDHENFLRIMEAYPFLSDRDSRLKRRYGWQLFQKGQLNEAKRIADELRLRGSALRDLNLEIAVAIETGQWEMLAVPLAEYLNEPARHDGLTLIRAAHLAHSAGYGPFQQLMQAAVQKDGNEAQVLLGAYTLAMECGLEEVKPEAHEWFRRALELSGPDGPVQQFELKELLERQLEWNAHSRTIDEAIVRGDMPLIIAAPALGVTVVDAILGNFLRNAELADPRKRSLVPVFSGRRAPVRMGEVKRIAMDISAVVVLGWLGVLPKVLQAFDEIVLPAGLLQELFDGRRKARASQRSRLTRARRIQDLVGHGLKILPPSNNVASDLAEDIGVELTALIDAARANDGLVIRPAPVHRLGFDDHGDADMSAHASHLADMHSLLNALKAAGAIDQQTEETARRYFGVQDRGWLSSTRPDPTQTIYLDSLSIAYLQTTHLLDAVVKTFDNVYIHSTVEEDAAGMLGAERRAGELSRIIDAIRETIANAAAIGKIVFGPRGARAEKDEMRESSTLHLVSDLIGSEAVLVDDRALNKDFIATDGRNHQARTFTSLDVIEELHGRGKIGNDERLTLRHRLRLAGAALVPVDADEIRNAAERSSPHESAEFRAIRESIGLSRVRQAPRFPGEVPWFVSVSMATKSAIMDVWSRNDDTDRAAALADAILEIRPSMVEWLPCWEGAAPPGWVEAVTRSMTASLMLPVELRGAKVKEAYNEWLEQRVLGRMRTLEPDRYQAVIDHVRSLVLSIARDDDE